MKITSIILAVLFLLFAIVQFNDPDPELWVTWYGYVTVMAALTAFRKNNKWVILAGLVVGMVALILYVPDFIEWIREGAPNIAGTMKAETPFVELVREFLGLLLSELALVYLFFKSR